MISVVIPTHNAAATLPAAFRSLMEATIDGLVSEVILADSGSVDATLKIADAAGATVIRAEQGGALLAGARAARKPWLLFLSASSSLEPGWEDEARDFIAHGGEGVAAFRLRFAGRGLRLRLSEVFTAIHDRVFGLSGRSDGLLVPASLIGAATLPAGDKTGLARRIGRAPAHLFKAAVIAGQSRAPRRSQRLFSNS
jgi:glycosyltransferase involved in cell wall biosynthesis